MERASIKISLETKKQLDELRHQGQTYDGFIKELIEAPVKLREEARKELAQEILHRLDFECDDARKLLNPIAQY